MNVVGVRKGRRYLSYESLTLELGIERINQVKLHERVDYSLLTQLVNKIREDEVQRDPVIIDKKTKVVLDGSHRVEALKTLGADKLLVCRIDYENPLIRVGRWVKYIDPSKYKSVVKLIAGEEGVFEEADWRQARNAVDLRMRKLAILNTSKSFLLQEPFNNTLESYLASEKLVKSLEKNGLAVGIAPDSLAIELLNNGYFVIYPPPITKEEVVKYGVKGRLFPPKTTRHIIPARPVRIEYPLRYLLTKTLSIREAESILDGILGSRRPVLKPPRTVYGGRVYEEALTMFE